MILSLLITIMEPDRTSYSSSTS